MIHIQVWPLPSANFQPRNVLLVEQVVTLNLPEGEAYNLSYALKLEVVSESGNGKGGWLFEGFTIMNAARGKKFSDKPV